jgi:flagella basal body P-ring formation protein FlgA
VFEAGQLQAQAARAGLVWGNPTGLRRVVVRNATLAPSPASAAPEAAEAAQPVAARVSAAPARAAATERVISRNDMVKVAYEADGVRLAITGRAQGNAAAGQPVAVLNLQSRRMIDAVAVGPGRAVAGPAARAARLDAAQQFAAR